jgi:hypothetical protein
MTQPPATDQREEPRRTKIFRQWKGVYTRSDRTAMPEDRFYNLENIVPIGDANLRTIPNISAALLDYTATPPYWSQYANINGTDYLFVFATGGQVFAFNIGAGTSAQINVGNLLSGAGSRMTQWKNSIALFIDTSGYYSWDGTTFTKITGAGVPSAGTDIAVYQGRVWIVNGRLLTFSGADDYTASSFLAANGAGSVNLTDSTLRSTVTRLWAQNDYLYIIGASSVNVIADLYVPSGASPPTPVFTNTNLQALIGSDQPASVFTFNRLLFFASRMGVYALWGVSAQRLSTDIDGTWQYIDFSQAISGGAVVVQNILHAAFLIKRLNDPTFGSNTVVAMWFTNEDGSDSRWWFTNYGNLTFIAPGIKNNTPVMYGFIGNKLYQLYADATTGPSTNVMTPLWGMEDSLSDKQVIRAGFEAILSVAPTTFSLTVDTPGASYLVPQNGVIIGPFFWFSSVNIRGLWQNQAGVQGSWFTSKYFLYDGDASSGSGYSKYVGLQISSTGSQYQLSTMYMDYKLRARW